MQWMLALSRLIDAVNAIIGRSVSWIVLVVVLISAGNAIIRKLFNYSSNGLLEIQWYLFSALFLLAAAYTLQRNEHIRIDLITSRLSRRAQAVIDILGTLLFLFPLCALLVYFSWPIFVDAWTTQEMSSDAGGLVRWPALLLVPVGFALLWLQGLSEVIKRLAFLAGAGPDPLEKAPEHHREEPV